MNLMGPQEAWEMGQQGYDPCDGHDHCAMCGVCGDENELVQDKGPPQCDYHAIDLEFTGTCDCDMIHDYPFKECLPCRVKGLAEDCRE